MWNEAGGKGRKLLVSCFMIGIRYIDKRYTKFRVFLSSLLFRQSDTARVWNVA